MEKHVPSNCKVQQPGAHLTQLVPGAQHKGSEHIAHDHKHAAGKEQLATGKSVVSEVITNVTNVLQVWLK